MKAEWTNKDSLSIETTGQKAILVIDIPTLDDGRHLCNKCPIWNDEHLFCQYDFNMKAKGCPLKHPLKYASNDFYIYDTKYLMENLDREINLLKGTKAYKEIMEKQNVQVSYVNLGETE